MIIIDIKSKLILVRLTLCLATLVSSYVNATTQKSYHCNCQPLAGQTTCSCKTTGLFIIQPNNAIKFTGTLRLDAFCDGVIPRLTYWGMSKTNTRCNGAVRHNQHLTRLCYHTGKKSVPIQVTRLTCTYDRRDRSTNELRINNYTSDSIKIISIKGSKALKCNAWNKNLAPILPGHMIGFHIMKKTAWKYTKRNCTYHIMIPSAKAKIELQMVHSKSSKWKDDTCALLINGKSVRSYSKNGIRISYTHTRIKKKSISNCYFNIRPTTSVSTK